MSYKFSNLFRTEEKHSSKLTKKDLDGCRDFNMKLLDEVETQMKKWQAEGVDSVDALARLLTCAGCFMGNVLALSASDCDDPQDALKGLANTLMKSAMNFAENDLKQIKRE